MLKVMSTNMKTSFQFKKSNPIKWEDFKKHLESLNIKQYGLGEAVSSKGLRAQASVAMHQDGNIVYIPSGSVVEVAGDNTDQQSKLAKEIYAILLEMNKSGERLKSNIKFYESHLIQEVEPESASPLEILELITPPKMFKPFESIFDNNKLGLLTYRFYYTSAGIDDNITSIIPWYDLRVFPEISNPDRFVFEIVCRDFEFETIQNKFVKLHLQLNKYIEEQELKVKR